MRNKECNQWYTYKYSAITGKPVYVAGEGYSSVGVIFICERVVGAPYRETVAYDLYFYEV